MSKNAGILFACREGERWEVCLARRAIEPGYGLLTSTGGRVEAGETPLEAAFRETLEEWFGGHSAAPFEVLLSSYLPQGFNRARCRFHVQEYSSGWEFHTVLVTVERKFDPALLRLDWEYFAGSAAWYPVTALPGDVRRSLGEVVRYFGLDRTD